VTCHRPGEQFWHIYQNFGDGENDLEYSERPWKLAGILASQMHANESISVQYHNFAGLPKLMQIVFARVGGAKGQANNSRGVNELGIPFHRKTLWSSNLIQRRGTPCRLQENPVFG
jgi:hypothetical protein